MADGRFDFDLLARPWIAVVNTGGQRREIGVLEAFRDAHQIREVSDPSPLATAGIYRLLFAILQRHDPLPDAEDWIDSWGENWQRGRFSDELVNRIAAGCAGRLNLFDSARPFFQTTDVPGSPSAGALKTIGYLFLDESTGTNVTHFSHRGDVGHACCPACCARGLVALPSFAISGGAGIKPSINGTPPIYVVPAGRNLFETLLLNHLSREFLPKLASPADTGPIWEHSGVIESKLEKTRVGFLESLTWPSRRVRLYPEAGGTCSHCGAQAETLVRRMVFAQGWSRPKEAPAWDDPWIALRVPPREPTADPRPVVPREGREVWRDYTSLFGTVNPGPNARARRPTVLEQVDLLVREEVLSRGQPIHYETFALRTDGKAKIFEWRQDGFVFPPALLGSRGATVAIETALAEAEDVAAVLRRAVRKLHPMLDRRRPDPQAVKKLLDGLVTRSGRSYWIQLEARFRLCLGDQRLLQASADQRAWLHEWQAAVRDAAEEAFEREVEGFAFGIEESRRQVEARRILWVGVARVFAVTAN